MRILLILQLLIIFPLLYSEAQNTADPDIDKKQNKSYMTFSLGTSLPQKDFKSDDLNSKSAGLARNGLYLCASYAFASNSNVQFETGFHATMNQLNKKLDNELQTAVTYYSPMVYEYSYSEWISSSLLIGPAVNIGSDKFNVSFKLKGGLMFAVKPYIDQRLYNQGILTWEYLNESTKGIAPAFDAEISAGYKLNNSTALRIFGSFYSGKPDFPVIIKNINGAIITESNEKQKFLVCTLNFGAGLIFYSKKQAE